MPCGIMMQRPRDPDLVAQSTRHVMYESPLVRCPMSRPLGKFLPPTDSLFHLDDALLLDVHEEEVADDGGDAEEGQARPDVQDRVLQVELAPAALDRDDELKCSERE